MKTAEPLPLNASGQALRFKKSIKMRYMKLLTKPEEAELIE